MSMEKILKTGAASAIILTATAGSLCKDITIVNADNINKTGVVNTSTLNVRKGPSTKNGIITKIYKGDLWILDAEKQVVDLTIDKLVKQKKFWLVKMLIAKLLIEEMRRKRISQSQFFETLLTLQGREMLKL